MSGLFYWTGLVVWCVVGLCAIVGVLGFVLWVAISLAGRYLLRFGNVIRNVNNMRGWVLNGKPQWRRHPSGKWMQLLPTEGEPEGYDPERVALDSFMRSALPLPAPPLEGG